MTPIGALHHHTKSRPKSVAFLIGEDVWTYERLAAQVERLARGLVARGLRRGDRVALHLANGPELAVAYYACFRIGAIAAPLNIRLKASELRPLLQRLRPALYIGRADLYRHIAAIDSTILASNARFVVGDTADDRRVQPWTRLLENDTGETVRAAPDVHAPAVLLATNGTTGRPKFVIHSQTTLSAIADASRHLGLDRDQIAISALPMVHASGLFTVIACVRFGAPIVLIEHFDPDAVLDTIESRRCTWILGLPVMYVAMVKHQRARARNIASLRTCLTADDVCPPQLQPQFLALFGTPLHSFWASTEAIGCLTWGLEPGPVSRIVKGAQVRLVDDNGTPVAQGDVGELVLRGPNVTIGYWAGPGLRDDAPNDGWFRTGDLMRQDEKGDLWFVSRKSELIIRGGSHISPVEIERVLTAHPAVQHAAVIGVPDAELGQQVAGFVQLERGARSTILEEILASVTALLADYKVPESLKAVDQIPRNVEKIDRKSLLALISEPESNDAEQVSGSQSLASCAEQ